VNDGADGCEGEQGELPRGDKAHRDSTDEQNGIAQQTPHHRLDRLHLHSLGYGAKERGREMTERRERGRSYHEADVVSES
jgi:hypothetical protein